MDLLRDGIWQFVGAILAIAAIGVTFLVYHLQKQKKDLSVGVILSRRLLSVSEEIQNKVSITYEDRPVSDVWLVLVGIKNSGTRPILAADFERPLIIKFNDNTKILSAEVSKQFPKNLDASVAEDHEGITVKPLLLNPGDYIVTKALVSNKKPAIRFDSRIVDVSSLSLLNSGYRFGPDHIKNMRENSIIIVVMLLAGLIWHYLLEPVPQIVSTAFAGFVALAFISTLFQWLRGKFSSADMRYIDDA